MSKRIEVPQAEETISIPRSTFDDILRCLEEMKEEIRDLRRYIANTPKPDLLMTVSQAAEYCGVTRQTISEYRRQKVLTKVVRGPRTGYLQSDLDKVKQQQVKQRQRKNQ